MKRTLFTIAAAASLLAFGACGSPSASKEEKTKGDTDKVYTGVIPGADTQCVRYTVLLDYDDDNTEGDYEAVQTYFNVDSTGNVEDVASFATEGDFTVGQSADGKKYLKLTANGTDYTYFLVGDADETLVMTGEDLTPTTTPGMNYTLKAAK